MVLMKIQWDHQILLLFEDSLKRRYDTDLCHLLAFVKIPQLWVLESFLYTVSFISIVFLLLSAFLNVYKYYIYFAAKNIIVIIWTSQENTK